jgi:ribonuclease-3
LFYYFSPAILLTTAMNEKPDDDELAGIERILGYHFFEPQHLIRALTHPAYANELLQQNTRCMDQEAYSTLGDAVLKTGLILFLMERGLTTKGEITQAKEELESNVSLARIGVRIRIRSYIRLGRGAKDLWRSGEETILADTLEALIGAIFLDSDAGFGVVRQCIGKWFEPELKKSGRTIPDQVAPAKKKTGTKQTAQKAPARKVPVKKAPERKVTSQKNEGPAPRKKVPLVPQPLTPLPSSSRHGAPRGMKSGSRQPWRG